jgi:hypothetical protein
LLEVLVLPGDMRRERGAIGHVNVALRSHAPIAFADHQGLGKISHRGYAALAC